MDLGKIAALFYRLSNFLRESDLTENLSEGKYSLEDSNKEDRMVTG